ncbi:hypothetical protein [Xanthobacter sp. KR7-225]|uniref:hypothetical protein n=1 Tax=Xanthobacter sp. KR7-225 TaxID=3156613 RepID=UPI0032B4C0D9
MRRSLAVAFLLMVALGAASAADLPNIEQKLSSPAMLRDVTGLLMPQKKILPGGSWKRSCKLNEVFGPPDGWINDYEFWASCKNTSGGWAQNRWDNRKCITMVACNSGGWMQCGEC